MPPKPAAVPLTAPTLIAAKLITPTLAAHAAPPPARVAGLVGRPRAVSPRS